MISPAPAGATASGQARGRTRASPTNPTIAVAVRTAPTASPFSRSATQPGSSWVENPHAFSRTYPRQNESGSRITNGTATTIKENTRAQAHHGSPCSARSTRSPGPPKASTPSVPSDSARSTSAATYRGR